MPELAPLWGQPPETPQGTQLSTGTGPSGRHGASHGPAVCWAPSAHWASQQPWVSSGVSISVSQTQSRRGLLWSQRQELAAEEPAPGTLGPRVRL